MASMSKDMVNVVIMAKMSDPNDLAIDYGDSSTEEVIEALLRALLNVWNVKRIMWNDFPK